MALEETHKADQVVPGPDMEKHEGEEEEEAVLTIDEGAKEDKDVVEAKGGEKDEEEEELKEAVGSALNADGSLRPWSERMLEVLVSIAPLGVVAFGGPAAHIGLLQQEFVEKRRWLDSEKFVELMAVGQGLPGPTSTQMVVSLGAMRAGVGGGLLAFALWNIPSFIILVVVAMISRENITDELPDFLKGLPPAATSLVFLAAYNLGMKVLQHKDSSVQKLKIALSLASTILTILITADADVINPRWASLAFPVFLIVGGLITLVDSKRPGRLHHYFVAPTADEQAENDSILKHINISKRTGGFLILIWLTLLITSISLRAAEVFEEDSLLSLFEAFFRVGSIIYGGGQVVLPMLLTEVVSTGWVSEPVFFTGFGLVQSLPGPLFNFSAFLGAAFKAIPGAFVAWAGLFGPGILLILAFLPFWLEVRKLAWFKCFLAGVNATAIGLIIAACAQLYQKAVPNFASVAVFFFTGGLIKFFNVFTPLAILLGGALGILFTPLAINYAQEAFVFT